LLKERHQVDLYFPPPLFLTFLSAILIRRGLLVPHHPKKGGPSVELAFSAHYPNSDIILFIIYSKHSWKLVGKLETPEESGREGVMKRNQSNSTRE